MGALGAGGELCGGPGGAGMAPWGLGFHFLRFSPWSLGVKVWLI